MSSACSRCSSSYEVDTDFLRKISPTYGGQQLIITPPTLCPQCRVQRRLAWRNDRTFYHRKCDLSGAEFISMYPQYTTFPVYKQDEWHSDKWDAMTFGREYDFSRPFFEQWAALRDVVPHWGVAISNCQNSDYCNYCTDEKNCYLDIAAEGNENCYFNLFVKNSQDCHDCTFVYNSTLCYECIQCYNCYSCRHSQYLDNCTDCAFCYDCKGSKNCLLSINLRNKEYYILNKPHTKEEYEKKLSELNLHSYASMQHIFSIWRTMRIEQGIYRDMYNLNCEQCTGNDIKNSKNCTTCFNATDCEDSAYLYDVLNAKDCRDMNYSLYDPEASYEVISTVGAKFCAFYNMGPYNTNCYYSQMLQSCKDCFGCIGLKQKQYCILNKQYSKEEFEAIVCKIVAQMIMAGEWGEFFPAQYSPHGYNETVAQEYMPLTKEEAASKGFRWRESTVPETQYLGPTIDVPDNVNDLSESFAKQILICEISGKPYKIIPQELRFYKKMQIPIPRRSPDQRHKDRIALRNPRILWDRTCMKCSEPIRTSYAPDRPEKVYCERCYLNHIQ